MDLRNSIVASNHAFVGPNCAGNAGDFGLLGTNLSDDTTCGDAGPNMIVADPQLDTLADNGGPTRTAAFERTSPALEAATDCTVSDDQRYVARPQGTACDIGAIEFTDFLRASVDVDHSVTVIPSSGVAVVTGTVSCPEAVSVTLHVTLTEPTKAGKVNTMVTASDSLPLACEGTKAWSVALTPATGAFENGAGTVDANTGVGPIYFLGDSVSQSVKLFWGHK